MTSRTELDDMVVYDTEFGIFEKLKEQKDVRQESDGMYEASLYILYKNGSEVVYDETDDISKMKYTGIERMVYCAEWGEAFFNAFPQMDTFDSEEEENWMIRIGAIPNEYGEPVDLEDYV